MIAELQALAALLARDAVTVDDVVAHLGAVTHDYGPNVLVVPRDTQFLEANVVRDLDSRTRRPANVPAHVDLTPAAAVALAALVMAFGPGKRIPAEGQVPAQMIFYLALPEQPYAVALIAALKGSRATRLTLRRGRRLD